MLPPKQIKKLMGNSDDKALRLAGMVYDAALDQHKWPSFLEAFAHAAGGNSSLLRSADYEAGEASFVASAGYDPAWQSAYCKHYVKLDFYAPYFQQMTLGVAEPGERAFSQSEQRKTEIYNDYFIPQDKPHGMAVILARDDNQMLMFAAQRGKRAGAFGAEQVRLMGILAPHVTRAMQVQRRISSITVKKEWALGALDQLRMGVILTNGSGTPLFANRAAEQMLATSQGIGVCQRRLALSTTPETARFYKLLTGAAQGAPAATLGGDMRIALPDGEFLHCLVTPISLEISARLDVPLASGCVAVFLTKPSDPQLPHRRLAALYGFTPAEAKLSAKIASGRGLKEAASELQITYQTARSQLKSVFLRTGVSCQTELISLLLTGMLAHCGDDDS